ncbi:galactoside-binding lectin [Ancylostoma caninum]|uniref:Galectin n=1 Tax=Ancylostoma caninum TaxID=29170 RepID=A0A368GZY4_ANCCA|nr:galactoside-binding lectin [Ancylostoma caninum]
MHVVQYPPVPSAIPLNEQLRDGCEIDLHGRVEHGHHKNFAVELLSGPHIVLHINFRFHHEHEVVMNSCSHGSWGPENKPRYHLTPLIQIEVNGHHLASFHHRFPVESVQALGLKGDVRIEKINFTGFRFHRDWNVSSDFGHAGYIGYGTASYAPLTVGRLS